jgi:hypothetical protein
MKARHIIIALVVLLIIIGTASVASTPSATRAQTISATNIPSQIRQQPGGPYQPADPRWKERLILLKENPQYEWKTPIEFYGRVLDQDGNPVGGATADIIWTDLSAEGSSHIQTTSDSMGHFSITGVRGKHMTVQVTKEGHYRETSKGRSAFEFAGFWEPTYYQPDPNRPIVFYLRKKGEAASLMSSEGKIIVNFGTQLQIPMPEKAGGTNASPVKVTVFENDAKTSRWKAQISVDGGGITPALQQFPFEAPQEGYQSSLTLDQGSEKPPDWQDLFEGGRYYIQTPQGYGILELQQLRGKRTLRYAIRINPTGSRNLEFNPNRTLGR